MTDLHVRWNKNEVAGCVAQATTDLAQKLKSAGIECTQALYTSG